ncbi:MAG: type II toxin-antitoxin system VapC family toxin [Anaerolineae bacterium]
MVYFFLDASAWVKRYYREPGSSVMDALFAQEPVTHPSRLLFSKLGFTETASALNRRYHLDQLPEKIFREVLALLAEDSTRMQPLPISDEAVERSLVLLLRHNLNASDALYLQQVLDWQAKHEGERDKIALVSTDRRLLRAAEKEGLLTFDPESADIALLEKLLKE